MDNPQLSKEDAETFRNRIEYEDELLNSRTNIILTMNGLAAVAAGLSLSGPARLSIAIIMISVNVLWIPRALEASKFIGALVGRMKESKSSAPIDEVFRWDLVHRPKRMGTTVFVAVVVPSLLLLGWIVGVLGAFF